MEKPSQNYHETVGGDNVSDVDEKLPEHTNVFWTLEEESALVYA
jgi:hypothetical protein